MAVPADWRLVLGHPLPAKWRAFPAEWRIFYGKLKFSSNWRICLQIEILCKVILFVISPRDKQNSN